MRNGRRGRKCAYGRGHEVVGGNPARHIKYRFTETQIQKLLEIRWWDWPVKKVLSKRDVLTGGILEFKD